MLESRRRAVIFLTLSFVLAAIAGFLFLQKVKDLDAQMGEMANVYVAKTNISSREPLLPEQVTTIEIPKRYVTTSNITDTNQLQNHVLVVPLSKGDLITRNMLKPVAHVRNENTRLVSFFQTDRVNFDQEIEALDRVDMIISYEVNGQTRTEFFMKDLLVAMVATKDKKFSGVALEVPMKDAPKLIHMQNYAQSIRFLKASVGINDPSLK
ncbi:Flp pilus assembly protein CpaB [Schinkia sp. CFF1]